MPLGEQSVHDAWAAEATAALAPHGIGPVEWVAETGSTNLDLLERSAEAPSGTIRVADHQTAGRGRRDRSWVTAPGDALLVSVLLRPELGAETLAWATTAVGVAAVEVCHGLGHAAVGLKWPNDLVVGEPPGQRKLAGILAQSTGLGGSAPTDDTVVVVGMGLNVLGGRLDPQLGAASLDELGEPPDRLELLVAVFTRVAHWLRRIDAGDVASLRARSLELSRTVGTVVRCDLGAETVEGLAADIDDGAALLVDVGDGEHRRVVAGDVVSVRPIAT